MTDYDERDWLAEQFEARRTHLRSVAYRLLGSPTEADDAVQEAWLRLSRSDTSGVENLGGWLTTVVARVSLDMLRSRTSRREEPLDAHPADLLPSTEYRVDPEQEALLADSVGPALLIVLETLAPAERLAFVLHDMFGVPFDEIGPIAGRSSEAARQLASRARRRVQGASAIGDTDFARQHEIVEAFLAAARGGDFGALLTALDPDVVLRADVAATRMGASEARGATAVAEAFSGRAQAAQMALLDGVAGVVWVHGGKTRVAFAFTIRAGRIVDIETVADASRLEQMDVAML